MIKTTLMILTILLFTGCEQDNAERFYDQMDADDLERRACMFDPIDTLPEGSINDPWCGSFIKERPWDEMYR